MKFLYANAYPTTTDGSFAKVGQRSLEVKPLANEVSISTLCSRLSLHTSSTSAATQDVHSFANPTATTGSKCPSVSSFGPSKKAKVTKEKPATSSRPEEVSRQTFLDDFMVLSSTSAAVITSTVPATSVAVTTTVTQPEILVLQSTEVPSKLPSSSIPISNPSISLVYNPPSISQQPQFGPLGPDHQTFEEYMQFYKLFDNAGTPIRPNTAPIFPSKHVTQTLTFLSGPSLATVDSNVNSLSEKVVSLTNAINGTTSAVNTAGEELKTLTATCSSKAETTEISTLQEEIVKAKEDSQRQFDALSTKVDAYTALLQQVLNNLNAPALTPSPSFTSDDRTSLNVAVEFIHQDTSDIPVIEGHLESLEAEVRKLASAQPSSLPKFPSLPDNDKEGEKAAEENSDEAAEVNAAEAEVQQEDPPSHVEGEKVADKAPPSFDVLVDELEEEEDEDEEDIDLQDQDEAQHPDDDYDDEEDQSLWFSAAATSSVIASKEDVTAGGSHETSSGTPSQSKSKGAVAEGSLKTVSLSEENPSQFSPLLKGKELQIIPAVVADEQIIPISVREIDEEEESLQHPVRPSRPSHWSREEMKKRTEMISHLEKQRLKIPSQSIDLEFLTEAEIEESVRVVKLIADCQRDASVALKIQSSQIKDKKLKKKPVDVQAALLKEIEEERSKKQRVSDSSVEWWKNTKDRVSVTMEITREDGSCKAMFVSNMESFGYMEWIEFKDALKKSKSTSRSYVEGILEALINRVSTVLKVPSALPSKPRQFKRKPVSSSSENVAVIRNETSIKFSREALFGPPPDLLVLDLSLPPGGPYVARQVIKEPFGIFFRDDEEELRFQRVSEIPICPLSHLKDLLCLWCNYFPSVEQINAMISQ
ncbi:hypothetical protein L6452_06217 [Arctium lappa]|uniref:Uncharacterized protein n=1 Tax=Arctium lappa TaxID=4217 RepID=A0ACB9EI32_ARCLA|nr:hypothetical protein L6452_06217 [Arctium lappa]